jgi:hypothetical protein
LKLKKKEFKRLFDTTRELDGWERYRALIDASDEAYDLIDISNREARFALIVMGALNAMPLILLTKTDIIASMTRFERLWMVTFLIGYAVLLLYFILQAIEALHPAQGLARRQPGLSDRRALLRGRHPTNRRRAVDGVAARTAIAAQRRACRPTPRPGAEERCQAPRRAPAVYRSSRDGVHARGRTRDVSILFLDLGRPFGRAAGGSAISRRRHHITDQ